MGKLQTVPSPSTALHGRHLPRLEAGDHLDQATFHARYEAMPPDFRAELIGGVVFVPSPLRSEHGESHALVVGWLTNYWIATPGTRVRDNATAILGDDSEPQPDAALVIEPERGGQSSVSEDGYATGPPEFIVEVASSSESIDLHRKRRDYEQAGVLEYVVVVLRQRVVRWFVRQDGTHQEVEADVSGLFKSRVFPGLWLDAPALLQRDGRQVLATLQQGLEMPEHAAFVQQLQARRSAS
ncbi:MAG TPA: Uma2 family endonuclease [Candidatus Saccharimonadia bacterium]|nr:Uma2 family endonuclease [Candidatus Saccharimonadia bacterium]